ncbi:MAG: response regulator transcription factor [Nitrospinae bacterium]|nr:response regulator transcription factor [Nitrospinota bacterium]
MRLSYQRRIQALVSEISKRRYYSLTDEIIEKGESVDPSITVYNHILTEREIEILRLKARGLKNKEIADKLCISPITVKNHIHNILVKSNLKSMRHVIAFAREKGIIKND